MKTEALFLKGRVCLVTGGSRKMGSAFAMALAESGGDVAVHYLTREDAAKRTAAKIRAKGKRAITVKADVTDEKQVERMFGVVERKLGKVDVLINNVGSFLLKPISGISAGEWQGVIDSNLNSAFYCCRLALPGMREQGFGRIINLGYGPCQGVDSKGRTTTYHMAKTALLVYTKGLAREEASKGITVNMISPGTMFNSVNRPPVKTIPAGRYARYSDLVNAVLFLLKEESSYITGNNLLVTGGG